jgi:hypothetical protein
MSDCEFSIDHWCETLQNALNLGYRFHSFSDFMENPPLDERTIILRHDVDVSPEMAIQLARIETSLGIRATYFIRLHARFYQLLVPETLAHLHELCEMDVDIGLHYERQFYEVTGKDHVEMIARDASMLSSIVGRPVTGGVAHRAGSFPPFDTATVRSAGLSYEAYAPEFVKNRKYISDSSRHWREGCLCQWLGRENHLTVLVHPVWWFEPAEKKEQILERIRRGD